MKEIFLGYTPVFRILFILTASIVLGFIVDFLLFKFIGIIAKRTQTLFGDSFVKHCHGPFRWIIILIIINFALPLLELLQPFYSIIENILSIGFIISIAFLLVKLTLVFEEVILDQFKIDVKDNLRSRKIITQIHFLKKAAIVVISILTIGTVLMTFDQVRQLGTSILASAGILGIIIGLAAQRSIGTLLAGLQIAFTQPIRIDDVVIVENEWGKIEEVTLTYVVVRIWDLRRMILPITYFIEKPFQNWTRVSADILGTVYIYVDYKIPVQSVREELSRILASSDLWDSKVCGLQVTNTTENTIELRALMSAQDASKLWSLRCEVREKLIEFIQKNYPDSLPKVRAELKSIVNNKNNENDSLI
ncbi:mechanosensitive ion channel family protein [Candidatus Latescibacterota bacterium]